MAPALEAALRDVEMALRRRRDVHDVRPGVVEQLADVAEVAPDREPLAQLPRHQRLAVADADDLAPVDPPDLRRVGVRDLAAADDRDLKHGRASRRQLSK